ncbi:hypothetical protein IE81DRAFT_48327 [Ceraceosorus guamensis]|uniref:Uncharacterized protein n=1 Tax=Ceraceosorus guamensis TaxID=1522189 RepID=A0A316W333_9BASI|nr:hypothetical protein IE81DRAFT_48327 [Ceraceosorus guamensis]PWN44122.1 hypothetical protein IE81DRAFT_48327 [Ceraceosorus guamensis]
MDTLSTTIDTHVGAGARASSTSEPQKHQSDFDSDYTTLNTHAPQFQGLAFTSQPEARLASGSTTPNQTTSRSGAVDVPRAQTKPQSDLNSAAGSYPSPDLLSASWGSATSASSKTPTRPSNVVAEGASSWTDPNASPRLRPKGSWTHIFSRPALPSSSPSNAGTVNLSASCLAPTTAGGLSSARASVESLGASQAAEATSSRKAPRHSSSFTRTVKDIVSGRRGSLPYTGHSQQQDASHAPLSGASTPIVTIDDVDFDHDDDHAQLSRSARQAQNISLGMHEGDGGQPSSSQPRGGTHSDMLQVDSAEPALQASDAPSYSMDDSRSDATATGALSGQEGTEPVETLNDSAAAPDVGPEKSKSAGPQSGRPPLVTPEGGTSTSSSLLRRFSGGMLSEEALRPSSYSLLGGPRSANPSGGISGALMQMSSSLGAPGGGGAAAIQYPRTAGPSTGATSFNNVMAQYDVPRSSILLNPGQRKTVVDDWRWESVGASPPANDETRPPLTIRRVPVVASARERREAAREAARAREIAREKERERLREKEREAEEKVWGIPKKAFYMGLPDLSFNAQASMLAGWGNGSGTTDFRPISRINRSRPNSAHGRSGSYSSITSDAARRESLQKDRERDRRERELERLRIEEEQDAAEEEPMDPEELAALNAIINTRRSAEAAMALASGQLRFGLPLRARAQSTHSTDSAVLRDSRDASATMDVADQSSPKRPSIAGGRTDSRDSVPSLASTQVEDVSSVFQHRPSLSKRRSTSQSSKGLGPPKIRFAPLPHPFGMLPPSLEEDVENGGGRRGSKDSSSGKKHAADGERVLQNLAANGTLPKIDGMSSAAEDSDTSRAMRRCRCSTPNKPLKYAVDTKRKLLL